VTCKTNVATTIDDTLSLAPPPERRIGTRAVSDGPLRPVRQNGERTDPGVPAWRAAVIDINAAPPRSIYLSVENIALTGGAVILSAARRRYWYELDLSHHEPASVPSPVQCRLAGK
jgi:hypothetical protein